MLGFNLFGVVVWGEEGLVWLGFDFGWVFFFGLVISPLHNYFLLQQTCSDCSLGEQMIGVSGFQ